MGTLPGGLLQELPDIVLLRGTEREGDVVSEDCGGCPEPFGEAAGGVLSLFEDCAQQRLAFLREVSGGLR